MKLETEQLTLALRRPFEASYGSVTERPLFVVTLTGPDGVSGHGEAAPLEPYDGVAPRRVLTALERYSRLLEDAEALPAAELLAVCPQPTICPRRLQQSTSRCGTGRRVCVASRSRR